VVQTVTFLTVGPEKEYTNVSKFWGLPKKFEGVKVSPNFVIFWLFLPFLHNGGSYLQSENGLSNYGHVPTRWWKNGVLHPIIVFFSQHMPMPSSTQNKNETRRLTRRCFVELEYLCPQGGCKWVVITHFMVDQSTPFFTIS